MRAYEAVIRTLEAEGVETVFALMAEDTMHLLAELKENWGGEIRVVESRHEQGAMAMADGYSRASDGVGVCIVGRGPGVAQTGTSLVTARKRGSSMLALVPEMALSADHDPKEFEQEAFLRSTIGEVVPARDGETLLPRLREGFRKARVGEGPVAVQVPWDVLDGDVDPPEDLGEARPSESGSRPRLEPDDSRIEAAVDAYLESDATKPPVVLAGRGAMASDARAALEELAERTNAMLATTLQAHGYFEGHPYALGFVGEWGGNLANEYLSEADCVFAVGCSLNPHTTDEGYLIRDEAKLIHVDREPANIGRYVPADVGVEADARAAAEALVGELERLDIDREGEFWTDRLRERIAGTPALDEGKFEGRPDRMDPRDLIRTLDRLLPEDRVVVTDGGHFTRWVVDGISARTPEEFIWTLDFAAIGQGTGAGIGASLASSWPCVTFCGDAGFMMAIQEVETAARNGVPVTVVVMNDGALGSEYHNLAVEGGYTDAALIDAPDLAAAAEAFGAESYTARSIDEVEALSDVLGSEPEGPLVVDCKVSPEVRHRSKM